jgi:hypothetical protein
MSKFTLSTDANQRTVSTTLSVTTTTANYVLKTLGVSGKTLRLANTGNVGLYYAISSSTVTATTNDVFLPAGAVEFVNISRELFGQRNIGYITASGSTGLNIAVGGED